MCLSDLEPTYGCDDVPVVGADGRVQERQFVPQRSKLLQRNNLRKGEPLSARAGDGLLPHKQPASHLSLLQSPAAFLRRPIADEVLEHKCAQLAAITGSLAARSLPCTQIWVFGFLERKVEEVSRRLLQPKHTLLFIYSLLHTDVFTLTVGGGQEVPSFRLSCGAADLRSVM